MVGAIFASIGVVLGAMGAHGLEDLLNPDFDDIPKRLTNWNTGVRYQMYHSIAIILVGVLAISTGASRLYNVAGWAFIVGIILFSGCLYGWCLTDNTPLVMIVPLGGLALIVAWLSVAFGAYCSAYCGIDRD